MSASRLFLALGVLPAALGAACVNPPTIAERRVERAFRVAPGSMVRVDLGGGRVTTVNGPDGVVEVALYIQARSTRGERAADRILSAVDVSATQVGDEVRVVQRRTNNVFRSELWWHEGVDIRARLTVPANVRLDLETRGGKVAIQGERTAEVRARTNGGSIEADGGASGMLLATSGGSIKVARALGALQADTSGGSIAVTYVGPTASRVDLGTSGGSIRVGIDPAAPLTLQADTRGGRVQIEGLEFVGYAERRSHVSGTINGGKGGSLRASTSGGSINVHDAGDPGPSSATASRPSPEDAGAFSPGAGPRRLTATVSLSAATRSQPR